MGDSWFAVRELQSGIHLIAEPVHVATYLVQGRRRAILIDTGLGISNIRPVVEELTDLEILVVNTHYHFDHSGGNHHFERIAIQREGKDRLAEPVSEEILQRYMSYTQDMLEHFNVYCELDDRFFHFLTEETTPRPLPPGFSPEEWRYVPTVPAKLLDEGDELDLGGRRLRVLHTPGHTPDCICLLDEASGVLFGGDTINTGPIYAQLPDSDVRAFATSTKRLADMSEEVRSMYFCHFCRYSADPGLLKEIANGFAAVAADEVTWRRNRDCIGFPVKEARFPRFSIFVADDDSIEHTPLLSGSPN
jgi:glyoxylase-like metal-dependent hydrolase (beta-lactamase superfamily II)